MRFFSRELACVMSSRFQRQTLIPLAFTPLNLLGQRVHSLPQTFRLLFPHQDRSNRMGNLSESRISSSNYRLGEIIHSIRCRFPSTSTSWHYLQWCAAFSFSWESSFTSFCLSSLNCWRLRSELFLLLPPWPWKTMLWPEIRVGAAPNLASFFGFLCLQLQADTKERSDNCIDKEVAFASAFFLAYTRSDSRAPWLKTGRQRGEELR